MLFRSEARRADDELDDTRITTWIELARCLIPVNALDAAQTWVTRAAAAARANQDPHAESYALRVLGTIVQSRGRYSDAVLILQQALALGERSGVLKDVSAALRGIGTTEVRQGRVESSLAAWRRALVYDRILGDEAAIAHCHRGVAVSLRASGDPEGATAALGVALAANEKLGDIYTQANCHNELAEMARLRGDLDEIGRAHV